MIFSEQLASSAGSMAIQFTAAAVAAAGIVLLSPSASKLQAAHGRGTSPHSQAREATTRAQLRRRSSARCWRVPDTRCGMGGARGYLAVDATARWRRAVPRRLRTVRRR
jgi:hypothetical protein